MSGATGRAILAGEAAVRFRADRARFKKDIELVKADLRSFNSAVGKIGTGLATAGAAITGSFILPVREFSRIEQLLGRFSAVFRDLEKEAGKFADSLATKINQSGLDIRDQLAQFQSVLLGLGASPGQALGLSKQLAIYSQDLVAFDDTITNTQEATDKFLSAIAGEVRPARRIGGADIRQSALDAFLLSKGIADSANEATELERVMARLSIVFDSVKLSGIAGQAEREVNTLASLFRAFKARVVEVNFAIGKQLAPQIADLTKKVNESLNRFEAFVIKNKELVPLVASLGVKTLGLGVGLKAASTAASIAGNAFGTVATAASRLASLSLTGQITVGVIGGITAIIASSEDMQKAFSNAFDGIIDRATGAATILAKLLEAEQYAAAIRTLAVVIERELLRVLQQIEKEAPAVFIVLQAIGELVKTQATAVWALVSAFNALVGAIQTAGGIIGLGGSGGNTFDDRLKTIDAELAARKEALHLEQMMEDLEKKKQERAKQAETGIPNRRIRRGGELRDIVFGDTQQRTGAIGTAASSLGGPVGRLFRANNELFSRELNSVLGKGSRFFAVLQQNARIQREERGKENAEERAQLKSQVKAIKSAFRSEAGATFGGATRLAFGIGETKVDEEQLTELKEINIRLQALLDEEFVLAVAGT